MSCFCLSIYLCLALQLGLDFSNTICLYTTVFCVILLLCRNQGEVHIYDVASNKTPLPCLRLGDSSNHQSSRSEGILRAIFLPPSTTSATQILAGGNYGSVRLWSISSPPRQQQQQQQSTSISNLNAKCQWSVPVFSSNGEGVCDMMTLPSILPASPSALIRKKQQHPLVLVAGNGSSLVLLDTNKVTRKAFSTTVTPTITASWDLYQLILREYTNKVDSEAKLPARRWMAAQKMSLLGHGSTSRGVLWYKIALVVKCGWLFMVEMSLPSSSAAQTQTSSSISLRLNIVHQTPRIQCFSSMNERLTTLGGMALQFSLPDIPVPSSSLGGHSNMMWLGDVKAKTYTLPSKDKYILCEEHGTMSSSQTAQSNSDLRHQGDGLILANFDRCLMETIDDEREGDNNYGEEKKKMQSSSSSICARLPLSNGSPLSLAVHPSGEWMVVGYGMNGRVGCKPIELVSMRKRLA